MKDGSKNRRLKNTIEFLIDLLINSISRIDLQIGISLLYHMNAVGKQLIENDSRKATHAQQRNIISLPRSYLQHAFSVGQMLLYELFYLVVPLNIGLSGIFGIIK